MPTRLLLALALALGHLSPLTVATSPSGSASGPPVHSNAIKIAPPVAPGAPVAPLAPLPGGTAASPAPPKHQPLDARKPGSPRCAEDGHCPPDEFCAGPGGSHLCQACRKRRKRCLRHAMCCPGNVCSNGICVPSDHDHFQQPEIDETVIESFTRDHSTLDVHSKRTTLSSKMYHSKGQESSVCLRSSDCAAGLCCARHFWSKICKPVLKEGQVCTKHRRKGSHGLEIFQRCYCGEGLSCRIQKDHHLASNSSRLHTCQRQ